MKIRLLILSLISLIVMSCDRRPSKYEGITQSTLSAVRLSAFEDFYFLDSIRSNKLVYLWSNKGGIIDPAYLKDSVQTIVDRIDTLSYHEKKIYAVRTESRPPDMAFHTGGALCLVSFFERDSLGNMRFVRLKILSDLSPLQYGSWGSFPPTTLIKIGPENYAYKVEPGFTGQGITTGSILLYQITDSLTFKEVLSLEGAQYDNSGMCGDGPDLSKCYSYETKLYFEEWESKYYKLRVKKTGTEVIDDKIINIDSAFYYRLSDKRYELIKVNVDEKDTDSK